MEEHEAREAFRRRMTAQLREFMALPEEEKMAVEIRLLRQMAEQYGAHQEYRARQYREMVEGCIRQAMSDDI